MILFRADGNQQIGSGHIMRCLSLADAFRDLDWPVTFVTAGDSFQAVIEKRGYKCVVLRTEYDRLEAELPVLLPVLRQIRPRCILLDSYFVTSDYMSAVRREAPLVYIDDQNAFDYPANLVINYTLYGRTLDYPQNKVYLLGPQYALLRKEFRNIPRRQAAHQVKHVLLSTGGTDPEHVALACAQYLRNHALAGTVYHIILGAMNQDKAEIMRLAAEHPHIALHSQVSDMRSLMSKCDAAISAGGTTLFELCACGLPTVTYILADNQIMNARSFEEAGLMLCAGDVRKDRRFAEQIFEKLGILMKDGPLRQRMAEKMQTLVDGYGAARLTEAIGNLILGPV